MIDKYVTDQKIVIRNIESKRLLDSFFVTAVTTILVIRFFLHMTGYPMIAGLGLHIAHMLFGGILMLVALVMLFTSLHVTTRPTATIIGGIGFGMFIDELGKFITMDNDYWFQPTIALIYIIFILLYFIFRSLEPQRAFLSKRECLVNALEIFKKAVTYGLEAREKQQVLSLLAKCDPDDPMAGILERTVRHMEAVPPEKPGYYTRARQLLSAVYHRLVAERWFTGAVIVFFILSSVAAFLQIMTLIPGSRGLVLSAIVIGLVVVALFRSRRSDTSVKHALALILLLVIFAGIFRASLVRLSWPELGIIEWGELVFSFLSGSLVIVGAIRSQDSRLAAYRMFERAVLVSIFLTQFFIFYQDQMSAVFGLFVNILILTVLQHWIGQEEGMG